MRYNGLKQNLALILSLGIWLVGAVYTKAQAPTDAVESLRADLKANRTAMIAEQMKLTEKESEQFWPLYRSYRGEVEKLADRMVELVLEYDDLYPDVPDRKASEMLKQYSKIEADLLSIKRKYLKKFAKLLPASKVFRFAQLDNRFDLATRVGLAAVIPILPATQAQPVGQQH